MGGSLNNKKVRSLYASILYKESYCKSKNKCIGPGGACSPRGTSLRAILFSSLNATSYALDACSFSIMKAECPFDKFSPVCLEIFTDIPNLGP